MLEDTLLIWKFKKGSPDALRSIYEKYRGTMLTVATALCNDVNTAEDVVQDCFISFARACGQLKLKGSLKGYLITSVVNRIRDRYRKTKHQPQTLDNTEAFCAQDSNPETKAICNEQLELLSGALLEISPEYREVLVLRTRGRMTFREIADSQGVSIPTVQRRYHSGLEKLRVLLNGEIEK